MIAEHFANCVGGAADRTVVPISFTADGKLIWRRIDYDMFRIAPWNDPDSSWYEVCGFQCDVDASFDEVFRAVMLPFVQMLENGIRYKFRGQSLTIFGTLALVNADMDEQYKML